MDVKIPAKLWTNRPSPSLREYDAMVIGDLAARKKLAQLCPTHSIHDETFLQMPGMRMMLVEAKATAATMLSSLNVSIRSTEKTDKGVHWLLEEQPPGSESLQHKVLFLNGGQDSKNFIINGGSSAIESERLTWQALKKAKVCVFYKQSFTLEWISDFSAASEKQAQKLTHQESELSQQAQKLTHQESELSQQAYELDQLKKIVEELKKKLS